MDALSFPIFAINTSTSDDLALVSWATRSTRSRRSRSRWSGPSEEPNCGDGIEVGLSSPELPITAVIDVDEAGDDFEETTSEDEPECGRLNATALVVAPAVAAAAAVPARLAPSKGVNLVVAAVFTCVEARVEEEDEEDAESCRLWIGNSRPSGTLMVLRDVEGREESEDCKSVQNVR